MQYSFVLRYTLMIGLIALLHYKDINGHGFGGLTSVIMADDKPQQIGDICCNELGNEAIVSYKFASSFCVISSIKSFGISNSNCYMKISFDACSYDDIICTPSQEFYLPQTKNWIPACSLKVGDCLLSKLNTLEAVTYIEFVKEPIEVYSIEVKDTHNFFVGRYSILTHNMVVPVALTAIAGISFGSGAVSGAATGGFFGPITLAGGMVVGGLVGFAIHKLATRG